ncbi:MAG: 50S ribosomal protein L32e [Thermoplasmata archaeon]
MADEQTPSTSDASTAPPKALARRKKTVAPLKEEAPIVKAETPEKGTQGPRAPKRAVLDPATQRALQLRRAGDRRRPLFVRQAAHRYWRIGRDESWRSPRGLQSKQRRHYGYRSVVVSIGYRGPARARGLVPSGFRPIIVHTAKELDAIDAEREAVIIARTVGTRRRLAMEEAARRLGLHILNPITTPESEE